MERLSTKLVSALYVAAFAIAVYFALTRPATVREAILWNDLVRPPLRAVFFAPDAWSGWIYGVLAKRTVGLFRLSELSLRLPSILACAFYMALLPRRAIFLLAAMVPVALGWFSIAAGYGLALAFCAAAGHWRSSAPVLLGLAIASSPVFAIPLAIVAAAAAFRDGMRPIEKVAIPAAVTAFIVLILPLSHAAAAADRAVGSREEAALRVAVQPLRGQTVRISIRPELAPLLEFYKARYRQRAWQITDQAPQVRIPL